VRKYAFHHRIQQRVDAHSLIAFLGYCLWICLERRLKAAATSLKQILLVEVFLPRITQPKKEQLLILHHLDWSLLEQPQKSTAAKPNLWGQPECLKEFEGADSGAFEGLEISPATPPENKQAFRGRIRRSAEDRPTEGGLTVEDI